jgi:hypothetical protein
MSSPSYSLPAKKEVCWTKKEGMWLNIVVKEESEEENVTVKNEIEGEDVTLKEEEQDVSVKEEEDAFRGREDGTVFGVKEEGEITVTLNEEDETGDLINTSKYCHKFVFTLDIRSSLINTSSGRPCDERDNIIHTHTSKI